jgi:thymidylate synthase
MNSLDQKYRLLLEKIATNGEWEQNRTGVRAKTFSSEMIRHDMSEGFPLLTIKKVPFKSMAVELEGFIKGITSKKWFQERNCKIWDEWCNPLKVQYSTHPIDQKRMKEEDDLGLIYGSQWRDFHDPHCSGAIHVDQLSQIVQKIKTNPQDRRMICSAWNPASLDRMALPPCHVMWQVSVVNNKLNLCWFQRSVDVPLGLPFNIASYGLLLHLLARIYGFKEGILTGFLSNVHFYENQMDGVDEILERESPYSLPRVITEEMHSIFDWSHDKTILVEYKSLEKVSMPVAI